MINYSQPQKLQEAVDSLSARTPLGTALRSAEIARLPRDIKEQAFFSASIENMRMLETMKSALLLRLNRERRLGGEGTFQRRDQFLVEMQDLAEKLGLRPKDEKRGGLQDIGSFRRLRLIWDTQVSMAQNRAKWVMGMDKDVLYAVPAQELVRVSNRRVPRDWVERWLEAMRDCPGTTAILTDSGRMVALKTDPIWAWISRFDNPFPPFDFNSGMGVRNVRRREAVSMGLLGEREELAPSDVDIDTLSVSTRGLDETRIKNYFGDLVEIDHTKKSKPARWRGDKLDRIIERAEKRVAGEKFDKPMKGISFGRVDPKLANRARPHLAIDDFKFTLTEDDVFHILREHGVGREARFNQRGITKDDFYHLLTNWRNPVEVNKGNKANSLELVFDNGGKLFAFVWNQLTDQKVLFLNTMYARKEGF